MTTLQPLRPAPEREVPAPPRRRLLSVKALVVIAILVAIHWYAYDLTEIDLGEFFNDFHKLGQFFTSPELKDTLHPAFTGCVLTFCIGLIGTTLALPVSLVFAVLGSRTMTPNPVVFQVSRFAMSVLRAIPSFIFSLIFVVVVGLGPYPGVIALTLHDVGVTAKLWWDAIDEADQGPVEALRTTGASRFQILQHAVFPTVMPSLASLTIFRLDDNVRSALVLGLTGAGGIGQIIDGDVNDFAYAKVATDIIMMFIMIVTLDQIASFVGKRLATQK